MSEIIKDVKAELVYLTDIIIDFNGMDWDMPEISARQADYFERYEYLMCNLFGKSNQFHHWNSALDPQARVFFEKTPD